MNRPEYNWWGVRLGWPEGVPTSRTWGIGGLRLGSGPWVVLSVQRWASGSTSGSRGARPKTTSAARGLKRDANEVGLYVGRAVSGPGSAGGSGVGPGRGCGWGGVLPGRKACLGAGARPDGGWAATRSRRLYSTPLYIKISERRRNEGLYPVGMYNRR